VAYTTTLRCAVDRVPSSILTRLQATLRELAFTLEATPAQSSFWSTLRDNPLSVEVEGWQFTVDVDRAKSNLAVVRVASRGSSGPRKKRKRKRERGRRTDPRFDRIEELRGD
jgi:hypothetical protein